MNELLPSITEEAFNIDNLIYNNDYNNDYNKINNLFLYSFKNPMKITEMYKDIDANGTGQSYRDLKKFLNS